MSLVLEVLLQQLFVLQQLFMLSVLAGALLCVAAVILASVARRRRFCNSGSAPACGNFLQNAHMCSLVASRLPMAHTHGAAAPVNACLKDFPVTAWGDGRCTWHTLQAHSPGLWPQEKTGCVPCKSNSKSTTAAPSPWHGSRGLRANSVAKVWDAGLQHMYKICLLAS